MTKGYVLIHRKIFDMPEFKNKEFSEREAWIYLICEASHSNYSKDLNGKLVELKRGELSISIRFLAQRFRWSKSKVERFLKMLEDNKMIKRDTLLGHLSGQQTGHLTICAYDTYQKVRDTNRDTFRDTLLGQNTINYNTTKNYTTTHDTNVSCSDSEKSENQPDKKPPAKKKTKPVNKDQKPAIDFWCEQYEIIIGYKYDFRGVADAQVVNRLTKTFGLELFKIIAIEFLKSTDPWILKTGKSLAILSGCANKIVQTIRDKETGMDSYSDNTRHNLKIISEWIREEEEKDARKRAK